MSETIEKWRHGIFESDPRGLESHEPGAKMDAGKIRAGLLENFSRALSAIAKVCDYGSKKYSRNGWQYVQFGQQRYNDAMWRHLLSIQDGPIDSESGMPHIWHMAWNLLAIIELQERELAKKERGQS